MPPKSLPTEFPIIPFPSVADFETYLKREHSTSPGIHLKLAKKSSGIPSITGPEAVETALCFGWIDGQAKGIDAEWWLVRYTPRRAKSIWSQKNVQTVERLLKENRMRPAGIAAAESAKEDGRWARAYAGPATITTPAELTQALENAPAAATFWKTLNKRDRYAVLWRIETASVNTRAKRIDALVQMLSVKQVPGRPTSSKPVAEAKVQKSTVNKKVVRTKTTNPGSRKLPQRSVKR